MYRITSPRSSPYKSGPKNSRPRSKNKASCNKLTAKEGRRRFDQGVTMKNNIAGGSLRLVVGMTCPNRNCLAVDPISGLAVYPASGVIVKLNTITGSQIGYIQASKQTISCLGFSIDGKYILIGEFGYRPALRVWSLALDQQEAEFQDHEYGVAYAAFSCNMEFLVSVGTTHDMNIFVYAWPSKEKISCNRFSEIIYATSFSRCEPIFVTCGLHHIRFWYPHIKTSRFESDTLLGRSVIMRDIKTRTFVDICFGSDRCKQFAFSVTKCGIVCKISSQRQVTQCCRLKSKELSSVQAKDDLLLIADVNGQVHIFNALAMQYRATISMPIDASFAYQTVRHSFGMTKKGKVVPETLKLYLGLDNHHRLLTAVLGNGDLSIWDINSFSNVQLKHFFSGHNKSVNCMDVILAEQRRLKAVDTIVSASCDGTIRLWNVSGGNRVSGIIKAAVFSENCCPPEHTTCAEVITAMKTNPDFNYIAVGDNRGLILVYDSKSLKIVHSTYRHNRSITVIFFYCSTQMSQLMLTGARDRLINLYDVSKGFQVLNSISLHSGSITALAMFEEPEKLVLISSALDRTVIMSSTCPKEPGNFTAYRSVPTQPSITDIQVCPSTNWTVLGRGPAIITVRDTRSFKVINSFRACVSPNGQLEKLFVDTRGLLLVAACNDRTINLLTLPRGVRLACVTGHAAPVSGLAFCHNDTSLISSSIDGSIFVWVLPDSARRNTLAYLSVSQCLSRTSASTSGFSSRLDAATLKRTRSLVEVHTCTDLDQNAPSIVRRTFSSIAL